MENRQLHQGDSRGVHNDEQGPAARLVERLISGHVAAPGDFGTMVPTAMNRRPLKLGLWSRWRGRTDLYWIPLGAGAHVVRSSGEAYEALAALAHHRSRRDLYHSALVAGTGVAQFTIEMTPIPDARGWDEGASLPKALLVHRRRPVTTLQIRDTPVVAQRRDSRHCQARLTVRLASLAMPDWCKRRSTRCPSYPRQSGVATNSELAKCGTPTRWSPGFLLGSGSSELPGIPLGVVGLRVGMRE